VETSAVVAELIAGPPTLDVGPTAQILGVSRAGLYDAIKRGDAPVSTIRVGTRVKILTSSLVELLRGGGAELVTSSEMASHRRSSAGMAGALTTSAVKRSASDDAGDHLGGAA
jgi:hypothetical protein